MFRRKVRSGKKNNFLIKKRVDFHLSVFWNVCLLCFEFDAIFVDFLLV